MKLSLKVLSLLEISAKLVIKAGHGRLFFSHSVNSLAKQPTKNIQKSFYTGNQNIFKRNLSGISPPNQLKIP